MSALWSTDRPEFLERLAKLAGGTTFRTPSGGRSTEMKALPDAHAIAAALSMARRGPADFGPDAAYCWALGSDAYRNIVTRRLCIELDFRKSKGKAQHRLLAAEAAWMVMIHNKRVQLEAPPGITPIDFDKLLLEAIALLYDAAWDALRRAEAAYRNAA